LPEAFESDEGLIQAAGQGDPVAFEKIVRRHQLRAWKIAFRFLGCEAEAADMVQEAFIRLLDAADRYRPTAAFSTYFHRIITRLCLDRAKKKQPKILDTFPDLADPRPDAATAMMRRETALAVRAALDVLPPNQRMAIVFRYYEDLSYEEIASALETTPKAVERLLARGRARLQALLANRDDFFHF
jgi:RNA polymerase sigma-70 factor (ECF subfamily)